jgi:hypothetical protein
MGTSFEQTEQQWDEIAFIRGSRVKDRNARSATVFAVLGLAFMLITLAFETSAVRLAAAGALWTGWNVLCLGGWLHGTRTDYVVYRGGRPAQMEEAESRGERTFRLIMIGILIVLLVIGIIVAMKSAGKL